MLVYPDAVGHDPPADRVVRRSPSRLVRAPHLENLARSLAVVGGLRRCQVVLGTDLARAENIRPRPSESGRATRVVEVGRPGGCHRIRLLVSRLVWRGSTTTSALRWYGCRCPSRGRPFALFVGFEGSALLRSIRRIGPGGIELQAWNDATRVPLELPDPIPNFDTGRSLETTTLSPSQRWSYQFGRDLVFHLRHLGVRPEELGRTERRKYRQLQASVAKVALSQYESYRARESLRTLQHLDDVTREEKFLYALAEFRIADGVARGPSAAERFAFPRISLKRSSHLIPMIRRRTGSRATSMTEQYELALREGRFALQRGTSDWRDGRLEPGGNTSRRATKRGARRVAGHSSRNTVARDS